MSVHLLQGGVQRVSRRGIDADVRETEVRTFRVHVIEGDALTNQRAPTRVVGRKLVHNIPKSESTNIKLSTTKRLLVDKFTEQKKVNFTLPVNGLSFPI